MQDLNLKSLEQVLAQREQQSWVPACGGSELPFKARNGKMVQYMWNSFSKEHAYYCLSDDVFLSNEEAGLAV